MPVTNVVEAILGREQLKWDALWRLFTWLLDSEEGHGLGTSIVEALCVHAFGRSFPQCNLKRECQLSAVRDGKGKWADLALTVPTPEAPTHVAVMDDVDRRFPGSKRKLENLALYASLARARFPFAVVRTVVLTNACDGGSVPKLCANLGPEVVDVDAMDGWKLLPLGMVGNWVETRLNSVSPLPPKKMELFLRDFVEWSRSLDSTQALQRSRAHVASGGPF